MRAVKSVLDAVSRYRSQQPFHGTTAESSSDAEQEHRVVLRAMVDINLPKFVADDVVLFKSILRDIFPEAAEGGGGVDRAVLEEAVRGKCKENGLQATPW